MARELSDRPAPIASNEADMSTTDAGTAES